MAKFADIITALVKYNYRDMYIIQCAHYNTITVVNNVTSLIYLYFGNDYVEIILVLNKKNFNMRLF